MINPELQIHDIVILIEMEGESDMTFGERGEVLGIAKVFGNKQYKVKWENGRTLDLLEDADRWMKEEDFLKLQKKKKMKESYVVTKKQLMTSVRLR